MISVGITGGIGSGKSTVAQIIQHLGFGVYAADERAKRLMNEDPELRNGLEAAFGTEIFDAEGRLIRAWLASQVFSNPTRLQQLNALVHPAVARDYRAWAAGQQTSGNSTICFREAAILFESGTWKDLDFVLSVYAPRAIRLSRVVDRDHTSSLAVEQRMGNQWPELAKLQRSDFLIFNDGQHLLLPQIRAAIQFFQGKRMPL